MLRLPSGAFFGRRSTAKQDPSPQTRGGKSPLQSLNSFHGSCSEAHADALPTILATPWSSRGSSNSSKSNKSRFQRWRFQRGHKDGTKCLEDFYEVAEEKLGEGGFGTVHCARLKGADIMRVVKSVEKKVVDAADRAKREIEILKHLDHPNICRLHESFEDAKHIHIVMEYIKGKELYDEVLTQGHLDEESAVHYMSQIFSALHYCHQRRIMHRDLKPENVMVQHPSDRTPAARTPKTPLSGGSVIKVIDFGLATLCTAGLRQSTVIGTKHYIAPEVMRGNYDYPADVWSAGVIFHTLLVGRPPCESFRHDDANEKLTAMRGGPWSAISDDSKRLIVGVLETSETERLSAKVALNDCTELARTLAAKSPSLPSSFSSPQALSERHAVGVLSCFSAFHRSEKLQRAALTAVAMQLTDSQMHGLREKFQAIDVNRDGHISREELEQAMTATSPGAGEEQEVPFGNIKSIFSSVDTDGSGLIDYSEFCAAALKSGALRCEKAILAAFRVFDINGDGQISKAELGEVIMSQGTDPDELEKLFDPWDADGDGHLSFPEFRSMVLNKGMEIVEIASPMAMVQACKCQPPFSPVSSQHESFCKITSL
eukprot:gnl/MRDRNA2_/MRDRNA2_92805_c0_seq1.p1 gnl/MRDRNA2_/MRDRNA2_92805_c0~~gnl/MRDRNA2_/MRDRNA2_92805_c0_seq1.p1  ORF type:complete len:600 (+),score=121.91 gnl/MRDRNA2_/MRDRNA2_92805_c0_seq1:78-1877(+)